MLILNKKSIAGQEGQLFEAELEKFRPHQTRLLQANHKQASLMKELTKIYGDLLQDKRVRAEQSKYETITRQHNAVLGRYKKVYEAFHGLQAGITQAQTFYAEMVDTVNSLKGNVETFLNNRRSEGAQLLSQIEGKTGDVESKTEDREQEKLRGLMERLSTSTSPAQTTPFAPTPAQSMPFAPTPSQPVMPGQPVIPGQAPTPAPAPVQTPHYMPGSNTGTPFAQQGAAAPLSEGYNPMAYPIPSTSPLPQQQGYYTPAPPYTQQPQYPQHPQYPQTQTQQQQQQPQTSSSPAPPPPQYIPPGYVPPPPPPRPQSTTYPPSTGPFPSGPGGYAQSSHHSRGHSRGGSIQQQQQPLPSGQTGQAQTGQDPWAGLSAWK